MNDVDTGTIDSAAYEARLLADNAAGRCFICELTDEATTPAHEIVAYRDEQCIVFFPEQQFAAVDKPEFLRIPRAELEELARKIGAGMTASE